MPPFNSSYSPGPSYTAIPITPSNDTDISQPVRQVDVHVTGDVVFMDARGATVTLPAVPAGYSIKCVVTRILATGTTASGFVGYP